MTALIVLKHGRVSGVNTFARALSISLKEIGYKVYFNVIDEHTPYYTYVTEHAYGYYNEQIEIDVCFHNYNDLFDRYSIGVEKNIFVTHGTQCDDYKPHEKASMVLCLSGQQYDYFKHKNRVFFPSLIEVKQINYNVARKELKKVLLCDLRYGHFYQEKIKEACDYLGLEFDYVKQNETSYNIYTRMNEFDLVIGYGRCIIEALSIGKCVIVYGQNGGDGYMGISDFENFSYKNFSGYAKKTMLKPHFAEPLDFYGEMKKYNYIDGINLKEKVKVLYSIDSNKELLQYVLE